MIRKALFPIFLLLSSAGFCQIGGDNTYDFLRLPVSARSAALGGYNLSAPKADLNLAIDNPASQDSTLDRHFAFSYINYISDVNLGSVAYAKHYRNIGTFSTSLRYLGYGTFTEADQSGQKLGEFNASEYAWQTGYSRSLDSLFTVGGSFKVIYSSFYQVQSYGIAIDAAGMYRSKNDRFSAGMVIKNAGTQLKAYEKGNREPLPFEIQAGITKRIKHAPFRISLTGTNLQKWDLTYDNGVVETGQGGGLVSTSGNKAFSFDNIMRHALIGVELIPSENFNIRLGYNYQRRQELKIADRPGLAGFSFGVGLRIKKFHLSYGLATYHLAGASNHLTLTTNLAELRSRGKS